jgi:predicted nucleotidyltransferase
MIENNLKEFLKKYTWIESAYIYGGYMKNNLNYHDIDLLVIFEEHTPISELMDFSDEIKHSIDHDLSLTTVSSGEIKFFIHQGLSRFYYFNVCKNSKFLVGNDILKKWKPNLTLLEVYERIAYITQRARNDFVDKVEKDGEYINFKLVRWIPYSLQEVLYILYNEYVERDKALDCFVNLNPSFNDVKDYIDLAGKVLFLNKLEIFISQKLS